MYLCKERRDLTSAQAEKRLAQSSTPNPHKARVGVPPPGVSLQFQFECNLLACG